jgi:Cd2+/Zn2+-exporting ATPase
VDGIVISGGSAVNQAPVTGESVPVAKSPGDEVFAGTVNGEAVLEIEAQREAADSTISRIVRLVEQAQAQRSPAERFVDRFAHWYTPAVVTIAALVAVVPPLLFSGRFLDPPGGPHGWLYRGLALLIVACPCALVISTPVTVVSALTALARQGVLVKGGAFLDALARVRVFAFDKTGTLTEGSPVVVQTRTPTCEPGQATCDACDDMLALATTVERRSEHPVARAIMAEAGVRALMHRYGPAGSVQALAGRGVRGDIDGAQVTVGSHALYHEGGNGCYALHDQIGDAEAQGQTVVLVDRDGVLQGFIGVADAPRPTTGAALRALKDADPRVHIAMLTGDNTAVAQHVAGQIGAVDDVRADLLPADKLDAIRELQAAYGPVAMVGDGVNDAPALALASVGVAMGGAGTAQAMETADIVLMQDDLTRLPDALRASRRTQRIVSQNIAFSLAIKLVFLLLVLPGWATLWMAVFADMGASLLVTLNGMRMLKMPASQN